MVAQGLVGSETLWCLQQLKSPEAACQRLPNPCHCCCWRIARLGGAARLPAGSAHAEQLVVATDWQTVSQQLESPCLVRRRRNARARALSLAADPAARRGAGRNPEGAVDWLVADQLSAEVLRRCLRYVRERCNLQGTLQKLAVRDPHRHRQSSGLPGAAARRPERARRSWPGARLPDLDNFRHVNDALGHDAGDRLILQVVARLKAQLEVGDLLARLGGDEFACCSTPVTMPGAPMRSPIASSRRWPNPTGWTVKA